MSASKPDVDPVGCWVNATYCRDDAVGQRLARREANQVDGAVPVAVESLVAVLRAVREWSARGAAVSGEQSGRTEITPSQDFGSPEPASAAVSSSWRNSAQSPASVASQNPPVSPSSQLHVTLVPSGCSASSGRSVPFHVGPEKAGGHCSNPGKGGRAAYAFDGATGPPRAGGGTACCRSAAIAAPPPTAPPPIAAA